MPETFLGELLQTKFFNLIKPLLAGRKTGIVAIKGNENGEIFMEMGSIVHARTAHSFGEEAFLNIMSCQTGKATFDPDVSPQEKTIFIPTENLPRPAESPVIYHGDECCKSGRPQCPAF